MITEIDFNCSKAALCTIVWNDGTIEETYIALGNNEKDYNDDEICYYCKNADDFYSLFTTYSSPCEFHIMKCIDIRRFS